MALMTRLRLLWLALTMKPIAGAEDDPSKDDPKAKGKDDPEPDPEPKGKDDPDPDPDPEPAKEPDWKAESRKHERREKAERKKREELEAKLKEREDENKSEQEKAVEKAKEEGRQAALAESEKERRRDRLEVASTRLAAKGIKVGEGDDEKTLRFADPDDALIYVERDIASGEIDAGDIFDGEGKVQTGPLSEALGELLERKPHLKAGESTPPPPGDADGGKGSGKGSSLEDLSMEETVKTVQRK